MSSIPRLRTPRLLLTLPAPERAPAMAAYFLRNSEHFAPWDPPRPPGFFTDGFWRRKLAVNREELAAGLSARFFVHDRDDEVVGMVNFTNIARGPFQGCNLGYGLDQARQGRGLMTEALRRALAWAFEDLGLHRVEANYVPTNERSGAVLRRLGFVVEGYARDYLFIDGRWRDHVRTALTNPNPQPPPGS